MPKNNSPQRKKNIQPETPAADATMNSRSQQDRRSRRLKDAECQEWRQLSKDFLEASDRYHGEWIRLRPGAIRSGYSEGFHLVYVRPPQEEGGAESEIDPVSFENPIAESTFRNLVVRGLLLAGKSGGTSPWADWAEFLTDTLPYHLEGLLDGVQSSTFEEERLLYIAATIFRFVDESVMACLEKERLAMSNSWTQPEPKRFAEGLKSFRQSLHLSQEGFAETIRFSRKTVSRWENGDSIGNDAVRRICDRFSVKPDVILKAPAQVRDASSE
jgi:DNA-binding transcriptional regulator YiaG